MSFPVDLSLCFLLCEIRIKRISGSYGSLLYRIGQVSGVLLKGNLAGGRAICCSQSRCEWKDHGLSFQISITTLYITSIDKVFCKVNTYLYFKKLRQEFTILYFFKVMLIRTKFRIDFITIFSITSVYCIFVACRSTNQMFITKQEN